MDFLDRLRVLMEKNGENNAALAKRSGIPYTTIDGLFKRGWEKAQISTIQKICDYYNVSLDYMIYGADKLSEEAQMMAAKYDNLDPSGKELLNVVADLQIKRMKDAPKVKPVHHFIGEHDSDVFAKYNAMREVEELAEERAESPQTRE